ncbi:MAG: hypothetical protein ASARMPRED_006037 [Alectoria sarmentosa]|nr:MAG: hypothetical protein ASARMPRED_006037 [Alectoria sarmentosa]
MTPTISPIIKRKLIETEFNDGYLMLTRLQILLQPSKSSEFMRLSKKYYSLQFKQFKSMSDYLTYIKVLKKKIDATKITLDTNNHNSSSTSDSGSRAEAPATSMCSDAPASTDLTQHWEFPQANTSSGVTALASEITFEAGVAPASTRLRSNAVVDKGPYTENGESVGLSVTLEKKDMDGVDDDGEEDCSTEDEGVEEARASSGIREYARVKAKLRLKAVLDPPAAQVMIANRVRIRFRSSMMRT